MNERKTVCENISVYFNKADWIIFTRMHDYIYNKEGLNTEDQ